MEKHSSLVADPPPPYSELEFDKSAQTSGLTGSPSQLENRIEVSIQEVEQTLLRIAPNLVLEQEQKKVIKRLTESLLKRNVREQNVLPTALQRQFTLEHVILKFDKPSRNQASPSGSTLPVPQTSEVAESSSPAVEPRTINIQSFQATFTNTQTVIGQWGTYHVNNGPIESSSPASEPRTRNTRSFQATSTRTAIGQWGTYRVNNGPIKVVTAYDSHLPKALICTTVLLIIFFFLGTPLSLFFTIPAVYWTVMAKKSCETGDTAKAKKYFSKCYCMSIVSISMTFVFFLIIVTVLPVALPLALS